MQLINAVQAFGAHAYIRLCLVLLIKQFTLDFLIQKVHYMPNKDVYFGPDLFIHVSILCAPWAFLLRLLPNYARISHPHRREAACFVLEYVTHHHIDCFKRRIFKRNNLFSDRPVLRYALHATDLALHLFFLFLCTLIVIM